MIDLGKKEIKAIRNCLGFNDDCRVKLESTDKEQNKQIRNIICTFITDDREREQIISQATIQVMNGR